MMCKWILWSGYLCRKAFLMTRHCWVFGKGLYLHVEPECVFQAQFGQSPLLIVHDWKDGIHLTLPPFESLQAAHINVILQFVCWDTSSAYIHVYVISCFFFTQLALDSISRVKPADAWHFCETQVETRLVRSCTFTKKDLQTYLIIPSD